jgi:hypothetical protein
MRPRDDLLSAGRYLQYCVQALTLVVAPPLFGVGLFGFGFTVLIFDTKDTFKSWLDIPYCILFAASAFILHCTARAKQFTVVDGYRRTT